MSIKSIVKLNEGVGDTTVTSKPKGWIVREMFDEEKQRTKSMELGIYITDDVFIGVRLHYAFKDVLIPQRIVTSDGYKYYSTPKDFDVALSSYENKKGVRQPFFIKPDAENAAVKVACVAVKAETTDKIISAELSREDNVCVRSLIDKDRQFIVLIVACTDTALVNPSISFKVEMGTPNSKLLTTKNYDIAMSTAIDTDTTVPQEVVKTKFIYLKPYIEKIAPKKDEGDDGVKPAKVNNKPRFNKNKRDSRVNKNKD